MSQLDILRYPDPRLHKVARPVAAVDDRIRRLVDDMLETMYAAEGVGLAACQIGVDRAIFVFDCPDDDGVVTRGIVCNPEVELPEGRGRQLDDGEEGCLSFPGAFIECARPDIARVRGTGLEGEPVTYQGGGLLARCLQHETDHTRGTVFGDRISSRSMKKLRKRMEAAAADYPPDWPA